MMRCVRQNKPFASGKRFILPQAVHVRDKNMNQPLEALRALMAERQIDAYLIAACDFHQSEYTCSHFWATRYFSGFTGENCTIVITANEACLWTDGRFFVQAEAQMDENFTLMRMGVKGVPTVTEYLQEKLPAGGCLGFDGRMMSTHDKKGMEEKLEAKGIRFAWEEDLADMVWPDRPDIQPAPVFELELCYAGESVESKLSRLRQTMAEKKADAHILTSLEDIAWLLNLRGGDIPCTPVFYSYVLLTQETAQLFAFPEAFPEDIQKKLAGYGVSLHPYMDAFEAVSALRDGSRVLLDEWKVSISMEKCLPAGCEVVNSPNPTWAMKAVKNETEQACWISSHIRDGVIMVRFMKWLKEHVGKEEITEISASEVLDEMRRNAPLNKGLSFETISAYGPNAAMMHYTSTPETNVPLKPEGFYLVDSGGHYLDGTTDITRTFVLGPLTQEMKLHFTAVARGMLNLANAKFLYGCSGQSLDYLARQPMWDMGINYRCGTGHGVGFLLSVHEGPQGFYFMSRFRASTGTALEPGMIITDEPGIYIDYHYGIRTENELMCVKDEENEYGQFLRFRHVTYCPIDLDGIDTQYMSEKEVKWLNEYHAQVYDTLKDHLSEEEAAWLKEATRPAAKAG